MAAGEQPEEAMKDPPAADPKTESDNTGQQARHGKPPRIFYGSRTHSQIAQAGPQHLVITIRIQSCLRIGFDWVYHFPSGCEGAEKHGLQAQDCHIGRIFSLSITVQGYTTCIGLFADRAFVAKCVM
eukprot:scaffold570696_cov38-Prasinocladus_malaysianus.AAC.1